MDKNKNTALKKFDDKYWNDRYETGQTGWDAGSISTPIKEYIDQIKDKNIKILIPGCGNAYEAEYLLSKGFKNISLIDISDVLINKLKVKFESNDIDLINLDFFEHNGSYDLIIEQTFFCAIDPEFRKKYAEKMKTLLTEKGKLAGVLFYKNDSENEVLKENEGPPFIGSEEEYKLVFNEDFIIIKMEYCYNSIAPRNEKELFVNLKLKYK